MRTVNVYFLPQHADPRQLAGSTCVVIDVLRATTTIACALQEGAREIIPCLEIDDAKSAAQALPEGAFVLGGERGGRKIEGFHLGNSPLEYTAERIAGKSIIFTTTNGTRAMHHCQGARAVILGAFVNRDAVCRAVATEQDVNFVCAGTDGQTTREDILAAGALVARLLDHGEAERSNDEAQIALDAWRGIEEAQAEREGSLEQAIVIAFRKSRGGENLIALGMQADLVAAARLSTVSVVPAVQDGRIMRLAGDRA